jgi:cell division protein FtsZ
MTSSEKKLIIKEEEIKTEIKFFDKEEDTQNSWRNGQETEEESYSLFSHDDEEGEDPNDLEIESFKFDFDTRKDETPSTPATRAFSDEKPVEFSFFVNNQSSSNNEPKTDFGQPKAEFTVPASAVTEIPVQAVEAIFQTRQEEPKAETKPAFEEKIEIETPKPAESEFTFVNKAVDQERISERRNKLKEFNSRYQSFDSTSEFESVPAFKRKNIAIDGTNASDQNINTYLSDNNGSMQVRENRFLNKDVD